MKKNNFFSRNYHQLTTRYNVYFNGNEAFKSGIKNMENRHKEDYTNLLPVFVSNNEQTRTLCGSDMDYAIEKAVKAIDKHSITVKPRRRKNKDSKSYQTFRTKKEFNDQLVKCYILLGKSYFYKKKYAMANNTFRFIQRQYADDEKAMAEVAIWLFRSLTEMGRYDEAAKLLPQVGGGSPNRKQREMIAAAKSDFYVRQGLYSQAIPHAENVVDLSRSLKRKPRYNFMLSQLYLKENQGGQAMDALKRTVRFNFNYEMVFNAKINMALAYQEGENGVEKRLNRMLRDPKNTDYRDRIYYALASLEEKRGNEKEAIELYWNSVHSSVDNANQQSISYNKLGDYYFKERDYVQAQACYDSCMFLMDSRNEDYDRMKGVLGDLTELVTHLRVIQLQDSLQHLAALPVDERNKLIDNKIQEVIDREAAEKEMAQKSQEERYFYDRNNMLSRGDAFSQGSSSGGDWYFYNPVTISLGKNDFKRKWGRRKLEDNWRRQNKAMVDFAEKDTEIAEVTGGEDNKKMDTRSRDYYLKNLPLTPEALEISEKKAEDAYYKAGELYIYRFDDPVKGLECFEAFINRFKSSPNLPMVYYLAYTAAGKLGESGKAARYKNELITKFPESDYAKGLQDPNYFRKVEEGMKVIEQLYAKAYELYTQVYYKDALRMCDEILQKYPDNKLKDNVLFLRAMCVVNTCSPGEGRQALEQVLAAKPNKDIQTVAGNVLASLTSGENPAIYTETEMAESRRLHANRNWVFDENGETSLSQENDKNYKVNKDQEQLVAILLPEDFTMVQRTRFQARLAFINASEAVEGKNYEVKKEDWWYKKEALVVSKFDNYEEASQYLNRIATDKFLLKIIADGDYRMFAISADNLAVLKRLKNLEQYIEFFAENYFEDRHQGEIIAGKWGTVAHVFSYEENASHDFVLMVPFREINIRRVADVLHAIDPAFTLQKEDYDVDNEMIVVKNVGAKTPATDYMNTILKSKELFDMLAGVDYHIFVITETNRKSMIENGYLTEYLKFFEDNYQKEADAVGVEDGDYIYNKGVAHKFVLFYSNSVDPFKLKTVFEEFNFAGLVVNNMKYDENHDCMIVSGFNNKEEAMRYFNTTINNRKLYKSLRNAEYTNFIITGTNLQTMLDKKGLEGYLEFFKKYYLN